MAVADTTTNQTESIALEVWRPISGYESSYEVSSTGRARAMERLDSLGRTRPAKVLKLWKRSRYFIIDLFKDVVRDTRSMHHLVYEAFIGLIPEGFHVHHKDENKDNNTPKNLEAIDGKAHVSQHGAGRAAWNKGVRYGETEAYKKSLVARKKSYAIKCEQTYTLCFSGRTQADVANELGLCREQVSYRVRTHRANNNLQN